MISKYNPQLVVKHHPDGKMDVSLFPYQDSQLTVEPGRVTVHPLEGERVRLSVTAQSENQFVVSLVCGSRSSELSIIEGFELTTAELNTVFNSAFFAASTGNSLLVEVAPVPAVQQQTVGTPIPEGKPAKSKLSFIRQRKGLIAMVVACAFGTGAIGYGLIAKKSDSEEAGLNINGQDFSDLQAKIKKQIEAGANEGADTGGLQGQHVAIETLKAMGLDPGKANTGCLVGVKP